MQLHNKKVTKKWQDKSYKDHLGDLKQALKHSSFICSSNENPKKKKKKKKNSSREFINLSLINAILTSLVKCPTSWLLTKTSSFRKRVPPSRILAMLQPAMDPTQSRSRVGNPLSTNQSPLQSWSSFPL